MNEPPYLNDTDKKKYAKFSFDYLPNFTRQPVAEIWHYTNANGLIEILKTGKLFSTQVTCLNDNLEQRFLSSLVHTALKDLKTKNTNPDLNILFEVADEALSKTDFSADGHFVTCFSEIEDDLGQWRGYGGGECGYSIGFHFGGIVEALKKRKNSLLLPMNYKSSLHKQVVDDVLRIAQQDFLDGIANRGFTNHKKWAEELFTGFAFELDILACLIKHPKFESESEWRITTLLEPNEQFQMEFRQKRTLLARHLPIDLTVPYKESHRLPISRIFVGPGPAQNVSRVSVGDLLIKYGYGDIKVEVSQVPYRVA